ncbi:uncharacterized protein METZ01_LOCUS323007, partial [marine metagenome]
MSKSAKTHLVASRLLPPEGLSVNQAPKQSFVGRWEIALGQTLFRDPFVRVTADSPRLAL